MKKEYSVNKRYSYSEDDWVSGDLADWNETYEEAFAAAEEAFDDPDVEEVMFALWEDGEIETYPLHMIRGEDGRIHQYKNGQLLWL